MALLRRKSDQVVQLQGVDETGTAIGDSFTPETLSFTANPVQRSTVRRYVAGTNNYRKRVVYDTHYEFSGTVEANPQTILAFIYWAVPSSAYTDISYNNTTETQKNAIDVKAGYGNDLSTLEISVFEDDVIQVLKQCVFTSLNIEASADGDDQTMVINFSGIAKSMAPITLVSDYVSTYLTLPATSTASSIKVDDTSNIIAGNTLTITDTNLTGGTDTVTVTVASVDDTTKYVSLTSVIGTAFNIQSIVRHSSITVNDVSGIRAGDDIYIGSTKANVTATDIFDNTATINPVITHIIMASYIPNTPVLIDRSTTYGNLTLKQDTAYVVATPYTAKDLVFKQILGTTNTNDLLVTQFSLNFERAVNMHYVAGDGSHSGIRYIPDQPSTTVRITSAYTKSSYYKAKELHDNNSTYEAKGMLYHGNVGDVQGNYYAELTMPSASVTELTPSTDVATDGIREFSFTVEQFDNPTDNPTEIKATSHSVAFPYEKHTSAN